MPELEWIKIMLHTFDDEKIKVIDSLPERDTILVIWLKLMILAGKVNNLGYIYLTEEVPYTDEMLATIFNRPVSIIRLALTTFEKFKMIEIDSKGIYLINFQKYQNIETMERVHESWKLASAKYREKQKLLTLGSSSDTNDDRHMTSYDASTDVIIQNKNKNKELELDKELNKENKRKKKEEYTPEIIKPVFYSFKEDGYSDIQDFDNQYKKFCEYWFDGSHKLQNIKLACHNWLDKVREYQVKNNGHANKPSNFRQYEAVN